jgi:hypothetical protein
MREDLSAAVLRKRSRLGRLTVAGLAAAPVILAMTQALPAAAAGSPRITQLPSERALLRVHLTSYESSNHFRQRSWDVLISATGMMQGFAICGCADSVVCGSATWTAVTNAAQLSPGQLADLRAALGRDRVGIQQSCNYAAEGNPPTFGGTYELTWYGGIGPQGFTLRENVITVNLSGPTRDCSAELLDLLVNVDDLITTVLGFPLTQAPISGNPTSSPALPQNCQ